MLRQTFTDFEFIIFDDGSTDDTAEQLAGYQDSRLRIFCNPQNEGLTKNLIKGMDLAQGEYVARMDADDICLPQRFKSQVDFLELNRSVSVVGSSVTFFDGAGHESVAYQPTGHDEIKCELFYAFTMLHPSVMLRKADFDRHGLAYEAEYVCSQDHDLWVRAIRKLRFANLLEPLLKMREHACKIGRTRRKQQEEFSNRARKWQLDELGVDYTESELRAFNQSANGEPSTGTEDLQLLEAMLLKIFEANETKGVFEQTLLIRRGAECFRSRCRDALLQKQPWGRYYWRSRIRAFDSVPLREKAGLALRSLVSR